MTCLVMGEQLQQEFSTIQRLGGRDLREGEIIEADYVTLDCRPREERTTGAVSPFVPPAPTGIGLLRGDTRAASSGYSRAGAAFWLFGMALIAASFWISGGHALVSR